MARGDRDHTIDDCVVDFYDELFAAIFSNPFRDEINNRLKQKAVVRQVEESADAASQSMSRFFLNERADARAVSTILGSCATVPQHIGLEDIANPQVTPEELLEEVLPRLPKPKIGRSRKHQTIYRIALHSILQVLMLVGPVMAEWRKLGFASTFEMPRRVVNRLNQISEQIETAGRAGQEAADDRFELTYRDYLMQRFFRAEAGTVRMTTNLSIDLKELFVMPRARMREQARDGDEAETDQHALMELEAARRSFRDTPQFDPTGGDMETEVREQDSDAGRPLLNLAKLARRLVLIGVPGSGKSTFLEWYQLKLAAAEEELVLGDAQAIPVLLRLRQLNPAKLPRNAAIIEAATGSQDRATLMPAGWLDRQMKAGRVMFMLDGLDETEPHLLEQRVLPWLGSLVRKYPECAYLVSSRPVSYRPGALVELDFVECDLLDFMPAQILECAQNWCVAVRIARNEPVADARREGKSDGDRIVEQFKGHPYIHDLARTPLMLSAICLVSYFEGGQLPNDRALLYKLCVEGLLHNWDQRRGIQSKYSLDQKLRVCREAALHMQADGLAEYPSDKIGVIFDLVLGKAEQAAELLEHVRYRTGLLLERRPKVFAFAHLTFQEYLAACAIHEGNKLSLDTGRLVKEYKDSRWREVIPLYCGVAPDPPVKALIEELLILPVRERILRFLSF